MPTTSTFNLPYPSLTDAPNGPSQMQALAAATDTALGTVTGGKQVRWLEYTGTPDASGYVTVTHGAGFTPTSAIANPTAPITSGTSASIFASALVDTYTSTTVRVRCIGATGVAIVSPVTVTFSLVVYQ